MCFAQALSCWLDQCRAGSSMCRGSPFALPCYPSADPLDGVEHPPISRHLARATRRADSAATPAAASAAVRATCHRVGPFSVHVRRMGCDSPCFAALTSWKTAFATGASIWVPAPCPRFRSIHCCRRLGLCACKNNLLSDDLCSSSTVKSCSLGSPWRWRLSGSWP